jgi:hypothetical protein
MRLTHAQGVDLSTEETGYTQHHVSFSFMTMLLFLECWRWLLQVEVVMRFRSSTSLRQMVQEQPIHYWVASRRTAYASLTYAMELACVFYFKHVLCLQRSAATTMMFRRYGWPAQIVTGAQIVPYEFHAWVEVDDIVVNDKPYMKEIYQVLERC